MDNRTSTQPGFSIRLRGWIIFLGFAAIIAYLSPTVTPFTS